MVFFKGVTWSFVLWLFLSFLFIFLNQSAYLTWTGRDFLSWVPGNNGILLECVCVCACCRNTTITVLNSYNSDKVMYCSICPRSWIIFGQLNSNKNFRIDCKTPLWYALRNTKKEYKVPSLEKFIGKIYTYICIILSLFLFGNNYFAK